MGASSSEDLSLAPSHCSSMGAPRLASSQPCSSVHPPLTPSLAIELFWPEFSDACTLCSRRTLLRGLWWFHPIHQAPVLGPSREMMTLLMPPGLLLPEMGFTSEATSVWPVKCDGQPPKHRFHGAIMA